ncbi:MAG: protein-methionine-sulfoxide reductase heme-binding subunit MsrQ [Anaerolineales bacterium]|jgi:sulfoxide reductase heme-binding subunit YedZ|nr:protein-methionine-sulfoxide reductase heme-binding subunit MsrQ [Anaerolineales bacterium]
MKLFSRFTLLQIAIHIYAWSALVWIVIELLAGTFSINPIQELEQRTGRHAITLLALSLLCTPLNSLFKWSEPLKRRRTLGLYAFLYATIHVIIFVDLDYGLAWSQIAQTVLQKPYIIVGATTFLLLVPLAFTSFDIWKKRLGKNWKRLHRLVYLIAPLAVLHYIWSKKGDLLSLSGDIIRPLIYGLALAIFLIVRIPSVRKFLASLPSLGLVLFPKKDQPPAQRDPQTGD